jgi:hypothetical protein
MNDPRDKYLITILFTLILLSASITFWRYMVQHDYEVVASEEETSLLEE